MDGPTKPERPEPNRTQPPPAVRVRREYRFRIAQLVRTEREQRIERVIQVHRKHRHQPSD